jgi:hypothetical protein
MHSQLDGSDSESVAEIDPLSIVGLIGDHIQYPDMDPPGTCESCSRRIYGFELRRCRLCKCRCCNTCQTNGYCHPCHLWYERVAREASVLTRQEVGEVVSTGGQLEVCSSAVVEDVSDDPLAVVPTVLVVPMNQVLGDTWAGRAFACLSGPQCDHVLAMFERGFGYGSDCSGADAARKAITDIATHIRRPMPRFEFASEDPSPAGDKARAFLTMNDAPKKFLRDMMERKFSRGGFTAFDHYSNSSVAISGDDCSLYTGGTLCRGFSPSNTLCREKVANSYGESQASGGKSSRTLWTALETIRVCKFAFSVLENTYNSKLVQVLVRAMLMPTFGMFHFHIFVCNARFFKHPSSRPRIFLCIQRKACAVLLPMSEWAALLEAMAGTFGGILDVEEILVPRELLGVDIDYVDELNRLMMSKDKQSLADVSAELSGKGWERCFLKHQLCRTRLRQQFGIVVPSIAEFKEQSSSLGFGPWLDALPLREADIVRMQSFARNQLYPDPDGPARKCRLIWDISPNLHFSCFKHEAMAGYVPCFLREHRYYDTVEDRTYLGKEMLWMQGFPTDTILQLDQASASAVARFGALETALGRPLRGLKNGRLTNSSLSSIAGDTIPVHMIGAILMCACASTDFTVGFLSSDAARHCNDGKKRRLATDPTSLFVTPIGPKHEIKSRTVLDALPCK